MFIKPASLFNEVGNLASILSCTVINFTVEASRDKRL